MLSLLFKTAATSDFATAIKVAILFQQVAPPTIDGAQKPLKPGGYSDSGADIAFNLKKLEWHVITPTEDPNSTEAFDWVFPDTVDGIRQAIAAGANTLWLNIPLFGGHPIEAYVDTPNLQLVGQLPALVHWFDDKWCANSILTKAALNIAKQILIGNDIAENIYALTDINEEFLTSQNITFPIVVKPVRGRGSEGVKLIQSFEEFKRIATEMLKPLGISDQKYYQYGNHIIIESYLPGQEVTVTIMPPGEYQIDGTLIAKEDHWTLPLVERFNHQEGIAPYNGSIAVTQNSRVLAYEEISAHHETLIMQCIEAGKIFMTRAPIRIDARQDADGTFQIFDINFKPNMTGPGRPGRDDQDSLVSMAARAIGWSFDDLIQNILKQSWPIGDLKKYLHPDDLEKEIEQNAQNSRFIRQTRSPM